MVQATWSASPITTWIFLLCLRFTNAVLTINPNQRQDVIITRVSRQFCERQPGEQEDHRHALRDHHLDGIGHLSVTMVTLKVMPEIRCLEL